VQYAVINSLVYMYCTEDVAHQDCNKLYFRRNNIDIEWILPTQDGLLYIILFGMLNIMPEN